MNIFKPLLAAALTALAAGPALAAETKGPVTDEIGVVRIAKGQPIVLGTYYVVSGPDTALGLDQQRAVLVAASDRKDMVAGHPIRWIHEDDGCSAEGGQNAATKLAANQNLVAVVGSACSSATTAGAPLLWRAGIPSIATSASAPALTAPDRSPNFFGLARTSINDIGQATGDARWMAEDLGCKTAAAIHDGSPYAEQLAKLFAQYSAERHGVTVTSVEAIDPTTVDMRPVLTRIGADKPCVIYFPIFVAAAAQVVRQAPQISGLENTVLIGGASVLAKDFVSAAGKSVVGLRITYPDLSTDTMDPERYTAFVEKYKEMFGEAPIQGFHAWAYDGAVMLFDAVERVAKTDAEGNTYIGRKALRDAIFATKGLQGISGMISCDEHGDCKEFVFSVYEFTNDDPDTFEPGVNPKKIFSDIDRKKKM